MVYIFMFSYRYSCLISKGKVS